MKQAYVRVESSAHFCAQNEAIPINLETKQYITPTIVRLMAVRWLMLRQTQAMLSLLFRLSVSVTPGVEVSKRRVG